MSDYIMVKKGGEGLYEEKKSRFIASVYCVGSEDEVNGYIEAARKKYWDARHNCYAFVLGENNEITRCSDDGEPSGTAGKPILEVITRLGIHDCLVIVTRYFGGTLLGTGGLVRAYTNAAKDGIMNSDLVSLRPGVMYTVTTDYTGEGKIRYIVSTIGADIKNMVYTDKVEMKLVVREEDAAQMLNKITENTGGRALIEKDCDLPIEVPYNGDML